MHTPLAVLAANPPASLAPGAVILDPQVHVKIDRAQLPADPTLAAKWTARGFRMITVGYDQFSVLSGLRGDLATARDGGGGGVGDGTARGAGYP